MRKVSHIVNEYFFIYNNKKFKQTKKNYDNNKTTIDNDDSLSRWYGYYIISINAKKIAANCR